MVIVPVMLRPGSKVSKSAGPGEYVAAAIVDAVLAACVTPTML
jgi:hypothetical protein